MSPRPFGLAAKLATIVGRRHVLTGPAAREVYGYDAGTARGRPDVVVLPGNREELSAVARACFHRGVPMVPRGAGSCLSGGPVPVGGGVVVSLTRMNRIISLDPDSRVAVVEPGVTNLEVQKAVQPHGLMFAPDPASLTVSTIGGNLAENAGGPRAYRYGVTRQHVLGLEYVLADGTIGYAGQEIAAPCSDLARPVVELASLLIGSEGTLGLVSKALIRLVPLPESSAVLIAFFSSMEEAARAASTLVAGGLLPAALEIMSRLDVVLADDYLGLGLPESAQAMLLIQVDGLGPGLARQMGRAEGCVTGCGGYGVRWTTDPAETDSLWTARRISSGLYGRLKPTFLSLDVTVPRRHIADMARQAAALEAQVGLPVAMVGHAGDGNLHPAILLDDRDPGERKAAEAAANRLVEAALALGGSITGEHGVGLEKRHFMERAFDHNTLRYFQAIKQAFDPRQLLNPGKVLPDTANPESTTEAPPAGPATGPPVKAPGDPDRALRRLEAVLGRDLRTQQADLSRLGLGHTRRPLAIAMPRDEVQLADVLNVLYESRVPAWPVGSGGLTEVAYAPFDGGVALSTAHLSRVIDLDPEEQTVTVGAGFPTHQLHSLLSGKAAGSEALIYAVDGPRTPLSTIGGEIATNAFGPGRPRYGATRDQVLGLRFADPAGRICRVGARTLKDVAGYDVARFLCGTWGAYGVVTQVTLRLWPRPEVERSLTIQSAEPGVLGRAATRLRQAGAPVIQALSPSAVNEHWLLLVGLAGAEEEVAAHENQVRQSLKGAGLTLDGLGSSRAEALWDQARRNIGLFRCRAWRGASFRWSAGYVMTAPERVPGVAFTVHGLAAGAGWEASAVGHCGLGLVDFAIRAEQPVSLDVPGLIASVAEALGPDARVGLYGWSEEYEGRLRSWHVQTAGAVNARLAARLKNAVDPAWNLAPSARILPPR